MRARLFFASKWFLSERAIQFRFEILVSWCFFSTLQVSLAKVYYTFAQEPDKFFWARLKKKLLHLWESDWNTWRKERFCLFVVQGLWLMQPVRDIKLLGEWIRCLYSNVIDRLFVATSQSINDLRVQMLRRGTSQLALIRVPLVH